MKKFTFKILGLWISTHSGNCFAPALQLNEWGLTFRGKKGYETRFYRDYEGCFNWNSEHIARWFGEYVQGDEWKGCPSLHEYRGILGHHQSIN